MRVKGMPRADVYGRSTNGRAGVWHGCDGQSDVGRPRAVEAPYDGRRRAIGIGGAGMTKMLIRVDAELSEELTSKFPHLRPRTHRAQTTLTGDVEDQEELQGVLNFLSSMGLTVVEVVTIPE